MTRNAKVSTAAILLGIGLGGLVDGIALHQITWPPTAGFTPPSGSPRSPACWCLWSAVRGPGALPTTRYLLGSMLLGWGAFNLAEGIIDHHLLQLHHVRDLPAHMPAYDWIGARAASGVSPTAD